MNVKIDAFPQVDTQHGKHQGSPDWFRVHSAGGMTLRDYFAAKALQGWLAGPCSGDVAARYEGEPEAFREHQQAVADTCYGYADAMLAKRGES